MTTIMQKEISLRVSPLSIISHLLHCQNKPELHLLHSQIHEFKLMHNRCLNFRSHEYTQTVRSYLKLCYHENPLAGPPNGRWHLYPGQSK